jgi:hypothetical protein
MSNENISSASWLVREVFASFGAAVYESNCLETALAVLLATAWAVEDVPARADYDRVLERAETSTLGGLVTQALLSQRVEDSLVLRLQISVERRNRLAHRYFREHSAAFTTSRGQELMLAELQQWAIEFERLHNDLSQVSRRWGRARGIDDKQIAAAEREIMADHLASLDVEGDVPPPL